MRLSFLQGFNQSLSSMLRIQEQSFNTQNQISTGKRIGTPADDPVGAAKLIQLDQEQSQLEQFEKNISFVESRLEIEEVRLSSVNDLLIRVKELTLQAANGTNAFSERKSIAAELGTRLEELVSIANSTDANGEYIFAGFKGGTQPFVQNSAGDYVYQGDEGQRKVTVANGTAIAISDSGRRIFEDIPSAQNTFYTTTNSAAAVVSSQRVVNQASYDASYPLDYEITFTGPATFDVNDENGVPILVAQPYTSGNPITFNGVEVTISGTPVAGDDFYVESSGKQSMITSLQNLVEGLNTLTDTPADKVVLDQLIDDSLTNFAAAESSLGQVWAEVGARLNTAESVKALHEGVGLLNQELISDIRDLDYAEAISRLSQETFVLEAAQQTFSRVSSLSLFNFLR
ncbi:flagellar hook-associated protein FlgL [Dasania sp. GY-MA-18]|uniref:Flagellar hook-associated protein FlgL n=1 Tax=Dasania phycosphaerae TaxID=2950436 RepID=A0A9J6RH94_9GAMM|nr:MULTISPECIES: flagellar hook-associated protein FlgL [Dasania]MCR8921391.1 flagellar hook-associated protein FlgL [Dasania sp. GY-MA-18]MCZ0863819.1 flagellar hook-associated protein FlgL [Dasania phycosphaerae]MCZ0867547.1 flagellar hook-associated protein FlgL [Dasania phycosphaerae]